MCDTATCIAESECFQRWRAVAGVQSGRNLQDLTL